MFRIMWYLTQFYAYCYRISFNRKVFVMIRGTISYIKHIKKNNNNMKKIYTFKKADKVLFLLDSKKVNWGMFVVLASVFVAPFFYLNIYIIKILYTEIYIINDLNTQDINCFLICLILSLLQMHVFYIIIHNIYYKNNGNIFITLYIIYSIFKEGRLKKTLLLLGFMLLLYIVIRSILILVLGLPYISLGSVLWLNLSLYSIVMYIGNIIIKYISRKNIDYSIFSPEIFKSINISNFILATFSMSLFFYIQPFYFILNYLGIGKFLISGTLKVEYLNVEDLLKDVDLGSINSCLIPIEFHPLNTKELIIAWTKCNHIESSLYDKFEGLVKSIEHSFYKSIIGKPYLLSEAQYMRMCNYNSYTVVVAYNVNIKENYSMTLDIYNQAFAALSNKNKMIYWSSKRDYMALNICNEAYKILNKSSNILSRNIFYFDPEFYCLIGSNLEASNGTDLEYNVQNKLLNYTQDNILQFIKEKSFLITQKPNVLDLPFISQKPDVPFYFTDKEIKGSIYTNDFNEYYINNIIENTNKDLFVYMGKDDKKVTQDAGPSNQNAGPSNQESTEVSTQPWGPPNQVLAIGKGNHIKVYDPEGQNYIYNGHIPIPDGQVCRGYRYNPDGSNAMLLGNIIKALEYQHSIGLNDLSGNVFSAQQAHFIMCHLLHVDRTLYRKLQVVGVVLNNDPHEQRYAIRWHTQLNSRAFRSILARDPSLYYPDNEAINNGYYNT